MKKLLIATFTIATLNAFAQPPCGPKLVMHWDFNGGSTIETVNGWAPIPTPWGTPTPTAGKNSIPNTAMKFSPGQNLVYAQNNSVMDLESWTMTAVVRPDGFQSTLCQGNRIVERGNDYSPYFYCLQYSDQQVDDDCNNFWPNQETFQAGAAGHSDFAIGEWAGYPAPAVNPIITPGQWYCVTASYDAPSGSMDLWVDGVHVVSENVPPGPTPPYHYWHDQYAYPTPFSSGGVYDLYIGSSNGPSGLYPYWLDGAIDDIKIYKGSIGNCTGWAEYECSSDNQFKTTSVKEIDETFKVKVYPNPASNVITITTPADWGSGDFTIFNAMGAMVQHADAINSRTTTLDISKLPAGVYIIDAEFNGHSSVNKFIKQ